MRKHFADRFTRLSQANTFRSDITSSMGNRDILVIDEKTGIAYIGDIIGGEQFESDLRREVMYHVSYELGRNEA